MSNFNPLIAKEYSLYLELRNERKTVLFSPIEVFKDKERHRSFKVGKTNVSHKTIENKMEFEVEIKVSDEKNFRLKLFCSEVFNTPFFRYDSAGSTHWNRDEKTRLVTQQIKPPHFHEFNDSGFEIAYKTPALRSKDKIRLLENINECIKYFCKEGNVRFKKAQFPVVNFHKGELGLKFSDSDPLKNVIF